MSIGSEAISVDSGPESEFDFGDFEGERARPSLRGRRGQSAIGGRTTSNVVVGLAKESY